MRITVLRIVSGLAALGGLVAMLYAVGAPYVSGG
jgi:hypothetical protein